MLVEQARTIVFVFSLAILQNYRKTSVLYESNYFQPQWKCPCCRLCHNHRLSRETLSEKKTRIYVCLTARFIRLRLQRPCQRSDLGRHRYAAKLKWGKFCSAPNMKASFNTVVNHFITGMHRISGATLVRRVIRALAVGEQNQSFTLFFCWNVKEYWTSNQTQNSIKWKTPQHKTYTQGSLVAWNLQTISRTMFTNHAQQMSAESYPNWGDIVIHPESICGNNFWSTCIFSIFANAKYVSRLRNFRKFAPCCLLFAWQRGRF